jgi:predicted acetyltransferase
MSQTPQVIPATFADKTVLQNLLQFYLYDFSVYTEWDVEADGLFSPYPHFDAYWNEPEQRFPYLIRYADQLVGFVLVRWIEKAQRHYFSIAEFFILQKYRRKGLGQAVAVQVFELHRGPWEVFQMENNLPAQAFWHKTIANFTQGQFQERFEDGKRVQVFET